MAQGLFQTYLGRCQYSGCQASKVIYTSYQETARQTLVNAGWGTSRGWWYCPSCLPAARAMTKAHTQMNRKPARAAKAALSPEAATQKES